MPKIRWNHKEKFPPALLFQRLVSIISKVAEILMARVLLIEDDPDTGDSLKAMLELSGHQVSWARHGREAMSMIQTSHDVILTDILMPEMDGIESIQFFRRNHPDIGIVAMTAQRDSPYLRAATLFGARAALYKPFSIQELDDAIRKVSAARPPEP
jgi:CheY-like chemotaxis protein